MPEGDTVFKAAAALNRALAGQTITRAELRVPAYAVAARGPTARPSSKS